MKKDYIWSAFKGLCIGSSMMVPGVSGGSMAMILGIYDRMIAAVSGLFKKPKQNILFLLVVVGGALLGMVAFSRPLSILMEKFPYPVGYFFLGCVAGSIPMIFKKAEIRRFSIQIPLWILLGLACVLALGLLPANILSEQSGIVQILLQVGVGILVAIGLVLPGISVMQMLALMGLYSILLEGFSTLNFGLLAGFIPLVIGCVGGIFLLTGLMDYAMKHYPLPSYLVILGFVLGSLKELYVELVPGVPAGWDILFSALAALLGFFLVLRLSKYDT